MREGWTLKLACGCLGVLVAVGCAPKRVLRDGRVLTPQQEPYPVATHPPPAPARADSQAVAAETPVAAPRPLPAPPRSEVAYQVVTAAREQVGIPYRYGGSRPETGFDCSGLVQWVYQRAGIALPRVVTDQAQVGEQVDRGEVRPGDLLFFATRGGETITHVGIYLGKHRFLHAPSSGDLVRTDSLNDRWWRRRWKDSRRVIAADDATAMR